MRKYLLSPRAQIDVEEIWEYTESIWGIEQAISYTYMIKRTLEALTANPELGRSCDEIRSGYYKYLTGSHIIFYRQTNKALTVIRILHKSMDFDAHL